MQADGIQRETVKNHMEYRQTIDPVSKNNGKNLYPVLLDLSSKNVLVIAGSGKEEAKAMNYLHVLTACTDHLAVLAPSPSPALKDYANRMMIHLMEKSYVRADLYGADIVISTLEDADINDDIHAACKTLGIRVQITAQPYRSDFISAL